MANGDFWSTFLEEQAQAPLAYEVFRPQQLRPRLGQNYLDYWQKQQGNVRNEYGAWIARLGLAGKLPPPPTPMGPEFRYQTFLQNFPWLQRYLGLGPEERDERASLFAPRMRWSI